MHAVIYRIQVVNMFGLKTIKNQIAQVSQVNSVLHEPYPPKQIKTVSQPKLDFCSSGWVLGENKPVRTMHLSVMWQRWWGGWQ